VSLAELGSANVQVRPSEAATIVSEICRRHLAGAVRAIPSAQIVRLTPSGEILIEGPLDTQQSPIIAAAQLLDLLLPGFDAAPEFRVPGGLRLIVARAFHTLDLPPFPSVERFCDALRRFATDEVRDAARNVFERWLAGRIATMPHDTGPRELTISDVRRARRSTGTTLGEIAAASGIDERRLRELEWGYLRDWKADDRSRADLAAYARAAGLDEQLVLDIVWPMIEDEANEVEAAGLVSVEDVPIGEALIRYAPAEVVPAGVTARRRGWWSQPWIGVAAAAALLVALAPAAWDQARHAMARVSPPPAEQVQPVSGTAGHAPTLAEHGYPQAAAGSKAAETVAHRRSQAETDGGGTASVRAVGYSPTFTNTGSALFFHERDADGSVLERADLDDTGTVLKITRVVDDHSQNFHARPSPDGKQIAFDSDREGARAVFIADADGTHVHRVSGDGFAAVPSWSPDGRELTYVKAEPNAPDVWNLWIADLGSGRERRVTSYRVGQPWGASWFPDGKRVAYSHETDLVILDLASGATRTFRSPRPGHLVRTPAVSPDGKHIMFQVRHDGAWLLDLPSGSMRRVLDDPSAEEYAWSPDGRRVAFHSNRSGGWAVWIMAE
jgi:WD40 repeat protein